MQMTITVEEIVNRHDLPGGHIELDTRLDAAQLYKIADTTLTSEERAILDAYRQNRLLEELLTQGEADLIDAYRTNPDAVEEAIAGL